MRDIKEVCERWTEEARAQVEFDPSADVATPEAQFNALRKPWQKLREAELVISGVPAERLRLQGDVLPTPSVIPGPLDTARHLPYTKAF